MQRLITIAITLFILAFGSYATANELSATEAASLYSPETTYTIFRKGKKIGKHTVAMNTLNNTINVNIESLITVRILKIPVFKFSYRSTEIWENDQLVSVDSVTTTGKDVETASLKNENGKSTLINDTGETVSDLIQYPTNHWHSSAATQKSVFNTVKGVSSTVNINEIKNESLTINDKTMNTTHYQYSGDLIVESWYDENQRWVKLLFKASDGSEITYLIDNP